jgi:dihydrofolate synthase/folylpolyglutamate synthase
MPVFHVAGTNGKGSVCAALDALLRTGDAGRRVGRYTSPHLVDFRERFLVNGEPIDERYVVAFVERWTPLVEEIGATFFEATTAMAFAYFAERGVDVAVIETGLGGRLDATNVVRPVAAAVTSIGIDHVEQLGATRDQIAREKAGIFKPGAAAVVGERDPDVVAVLRRHAEAVGAHPIVGVWEDAIPGDVRVTATGTTFTLRHREGAFPVHTTLVGEHQAANAAVALASLSVAGPPWWPGWSVALDALTRVRLPGRFHQLGRYIFDVAHNPDGMRVLVETLRRVGPARPIAAVLCVLADKDWRGVMRALSAEASPLVLTAAPTAPSSRAWDLSAAAQFAREEGIACRVVRNFADAIRCAADLGETILITGSFHTVGDAMARLQVDPLAR